MALVARSFYESMLAQFGRSVWKFTRTAAGQDGRGDPLYTWDSGEDHALILEDKSEELVQMYGERGVQYAKGLLYRTSTVDHWDRIGEDDGTYWEVIGVRVFRLEGLNIYREAHLQKQRPPP